MNYQINFKLKSILNNRHMTQKELSRLSGVRESTISDLVRGSKTGINFSHLEKISKALKLESIQQIIDFK